MASMMAPASTLRWSLRMGCSWRDLRVGGWMLGRTAILIELTVAIIRASRRSTRAVRPAVERTCSGQSTALRFRAGRTTLACGGRMAAAFALAALPLPGRAQDEDLPARVGRVADFAGELFLAPEDRPDEWDAIGLNYPVTSGDNLWVGGRTRRGRLRRRAVPARRRHQRQRVAPRRSPARPLRRAGPADRPRALARSGRRDARRHAEHAGSADAGRALSHRRPAGWTDDDADGARRRSGDRARERHPAGASGPDGGDHRRGASGADIRYAPGSTASTPGAPTATAGTIARDRRPTCRRQMVGYADLDHYGSWQTYPDYGTVWFPTTVAPDWAPYRDGYWTEVGGMGPDVGRRCALGLCAVPLRALGLHRRSLGVVPGRVRKASGLGAGARRLVRRIELGPHHRAWRAGLRLGAARLARGVSPRMAPVLVQLLDALQPAVCGERRGAPERAARALCERRRAGRHVRGHGLDARRQKAGDAESARSSRTARDIARPSGERAAAGAAAAAAATAAAECRRRPARHRRRRRPRTRGRRGPHRSIHVEAPVLPWRLAPRPRRLRATAAARSTPPTVQRPPASVQRARRPQSVPDPRRRRPRAPLRRAAWLRRLARCRRWRRAQPGAGGVRGSRPPVTVPQAAPAPAQVAPASHSVRDRQRLPRHRAEGRDAPEATGRHPSRRRRESPPSSSGGQLARSARRLPPSTSLTRSPSCTTGWLE